MFSIELYRIHHTHFADIPILFVLDDLTFKYALFQSVSFPIKKFVTFYIGVLGFCLSWFSFSSDFTLPEKFTAIMEPKLHL